MAIKSSVTSTLDDALDKAKTELKYVQKRTVELTAQIERLTQARKVIMETLTADDDREEEGAPAKRTRTAGPKLDLPKTDRAFWLALVTAQPQGTGDILKSALAKLHVKEEEADKVAALKQRQTAMLKTLFDEKVITSEGEQQKRKFFLPKKAA